MKKSELRQLIKEELLKEEKTYTIIRTKRGKPSEVSGTMKELIDYFSYTLIAGKSYENEKGRKKINTKPTNIKSLIKNLNNAINNATVNGYSNTHFSEK